MAEEVSEDILFPEADVVAAIEECWKAETEDAKGQAQATGQPGSIMRPLVEIDSHGIVKCFVAIAKATGIEIPETEAKDTGYDNLDDLIANLVPLAKEHFEKQKTELKNKRDSSDADSGA